MNFRTEIELPAAGFTIDHSSRIFMAGSCFSENISGRLYEAKFRVKANPTGILFNPASIADMLADMAFGRRFCMADLQSSGDAWFSWAHHGSFSHADPDQALAGINEAARTGAEALRDAEIVILTFGTAWVYRLADTGSVVANCHRQPAALFRRERLSAGDIVARYSALLEGVLGGKRVVFTVSPVRHLKDGLDGNSLSKATLRVAIAELVEKFPNVHYFPAFEIVNDDLRDYRFYGPDMVHPSVVAVDYIWEKFAAWSMPDHTLALLPALEKLSAAMNHRLSDPGSPASARFRARMLDEVRRLERELPQADFSRELDYFSQK